MRKEQYTLIKLINEALSQRCKVGSTLEYLRRSLVAQTVKNMSAMWETWVRPLGWEDPLEEGMATHSSILA